MSSIPATICMLVPYVEGGGSDQRARLTARYLGKHLDRNVQVVNRPGAVKGHQAIADAEPDGSTIGLITGEIGMMHWHRGVTALTPDDYMPLAVPFVESAAVIVRPDAPFADLGQFLAHCRSAPIIGSGGPEFSVWRFALLGLLHAAGIPMDTVKWIETYSGEQGLANVLAGQAMVAPITMTDARVLLREGKAKALATMEDIRHPSFPDVPTVNEAVGLPWCVAHWRGIVGPRGLPHAVAARYLEALHAVARDKDFLDEAQARSFTLRWRFGDDFGAYMRDDDRQFGEVNNRLGLTAGSPSQLY